MSEKITVMPDKSTKTTDKTDAIKSHQSKQQQQQKQCFESFLQTLSTAITKQQLEQVKNSLYGHMEKNSIAKIQTSYELLIEMSKRKLLSNSKLEFLKKLLQSTHDWEPLLTIIESFKDSIQQMNTPDSTTTMTILEQKVDGLKIIQDRQEVTYQEYETNLQRHQLQYETSSLQKEKILSNINEVKTTIADLHEKKSVLIKKHTRTFQQCLKKDAELQSKESELQVTIERENELTNELQQLQTKLQTKGKTRLNTFNRTFEKDELKNTEVGISELQGVKFNLKQIIVQKQRESLISVRKKHLQIIAIRDLDAGILACHEDLLELYRQAENIDAILLDTNIEMNKCKLFICVVSEELDVTMNEIQNVKNGKKEKFSNETQYLLLTKEMKNNTKALKYELLGSNTYILGCKGGSTNQLQFNKPTSLAIDSNDNILINDTGNKRLVLCNLQGDIVSIFTLDVLKPIDVAFNRENQFIVIGETIIRMYDNKQLKKQFLPNYIPNKTKLPKLSAIDINKQTNEIYIVDRANLCVQIFSNKGEFSHCKYLKDNITFPTKIHVLNETEFIIADEYDHTVKHFHFYSQNLFSCKQYGSYGIALCEFVTPLGMAHDNKNNIVIVDKENHRIKIMSNEGNMITSTGHLGETSSCLNRPSDVVMNKNGFIIASDTNNHRLVVYF